MKILVTGGSGMVGRALQKVLPHAIYPTSSELDLTDGRSVKEYMFGCNFDYVVHLAAHVGSLHDNIENSTLYFDRNVLMNTFLTKYSYESGVKNFLGILSTCIYPDNAQIFPIPEHSLHNGPPHHDLMAYSYAKRSHAVQLDAYKKSFGLNFNYLIPCNLYGEKSASHRGRSHFVNDLIFKICEAKQKERNFITLFGDGTPLRQFMHAEDLAYIIQKYVSKGLNSSFNVAPPLNLTIDEIARLALRACGCSHMEVRYDSSKPNGQHRKDVDTSEMSKYLPDFEFQNLADGIHTMFKKEYEKYSGAV